MLTLFQNVTQELTATEKETFVPMLLDTLQFTHTDNRITGKALCGWFNKCGRYVTEVRIRKMVNFIRVLNLTGDKVLIGASNGYFLTGDVDVVKDQIESMQGRIDSMEAVVDTMKSQLISLKHKRIV